MSDSLTAQAYNYLANGNYNDAQNLYEQIISDEPQIRSNYWYLGLCFLLQGQEEEAQMTWMSGMEEYDINYDFTQVEQWIEELSQVLDVEALRQEELQNYQFSWVIRQHLREINSNQINNLLKLILLSIEIDNFNIEELSNFGLLELIGSSNDQNIDISLLLMLLAKILELEPTNELSLQFTSLCSNYYISNPNDFINVVKPNILSVGFGLNEFTVAENMTKICLELQPQNLELLSILAAFFRRNLNHIECIETANLYLSLSHDLPNKIIATHIILESLMAVGENWKEIFAVAENQLILLNRLIQLNPNYIDPIVTSNLFNCTFFLAYLKDTPQFNHLIQNQVNSLYQANARQNSKQLLAKYPKDNLINNRKLSNKKIKIGYLSTYLRRHSVGWLARWIFHYHDSERFLVHAYHVTLSGKETDSIQGQIAYYSDKTYYLDGNLELVFNQICQDEIDILIDLDSVTVGFTCEVMALKPAPIQVTWLGSDASGIPAIDYFIADPYVLPKNADDYYSEKIWRLPNTYIAVDGFEVSIPTLSREQLSIPDDAVTYLCTQSGYKRNPDIIHLQMQIIRSVPNGYFLIKQWGVPEEIKTFFIKIAEQNGVSTDRLRFLPLADSEAEHRANLAIADVVLDTYPYNGATTTMETLWMCIPMVTRVGEQFAARNSYTMMMNAGITEGIAWSDREYIDWGVRFGTDESLRKQVFWKLRESRKTAPLWNTKQFTRDMESAYKEMWEIYLQ